MSVRLRALGLVAAVGLLSSGLLTTSSAGAATPAPLSQGRPVTASSSGVCCPAENAVDGKSGTRWASVAGPGPQWIDLDLGVAAEIHWDPPVNFTPVAYDIFIDGQLRLSVPGNVTRAVITGLTPNLSYGVFVVARDAAGNSSPPSAAVVVITPPCPEPTPPPAPANVHLISIAGNCVTIGWTGDAAGYHVYEPTGGSRVQVAGSTTNTATICGLNLSTFYLFVVTAVDAAGNESAPSGPLQVILPPVPCDTPPVCGVDTATTSTAVPWGLATPPAT